MSAPDSLRDLYNSELTHLWSANDQMTGALKRIVPRCSDPDLKTMLTKSVDSIATHTGVLKDMIAASGEKVAKEHCKGMAGLVAEATTHAITDAPAAGPVLDAVIISQYQRMTHYAIAGFGTAASYAGTLGLDEDKSKLDQVTGSLYRCDEYLTKLAETTVNIEAKAG